MPISLAARVIHSSILNAALITSPETQRVIESCELPPSKQTGCLRRADETMPFPNIGKKSWAYSRTILGTRSIQRYSLRTCRPPLVGEGRLPGQVVVGYLALRAPPSAGGGVRGARRVSSPSLTGVQFELDVRTVRSPGSCRFVVRACVSNDYTQPRRRVRRPRQYVCPCVRSPRASCESRSPGRISRTSRRAPARPFPERSVAEMHRKPAVPAARSLIAPYYWRWWCQILLPEPVVALPLGHGTGEMRWVDRCILPLHFAIFASRTFGEFERAEGVSRDRVGARSRSRTRIEKGARSTATRATSQRGAPVPKVHAIIDRLGDPGYRSRSRGRLGDP